jgi:hypothetical protein
MGIKEHYNGFMRNAKALLSGQNAKLGLDKYGRAQRAIEIPDRILKSHMEKVLHPLTKEEIGEKLVIDKLRPIKLGYDRKNIKLRKQYARLKASGQVLC